MFYYDTTGQYEHIETAGKNLKNKGRFISPECGAKRIDSFSSLWVFYGEAFLEIQNCMSLKAINTK
jgi:hypothetical protein